MKHIHKITLKKAVLPMEEVSGGLDVVIQALLEAKGKGGDGVA